MIEYGVGVEDGMVKNFRTPSGDIHYWINEMNKNSVTRLFLPGLSAAHRFCSVTEEICCKY